MAPRVKTALIVAASALCGAGLALTVVMVWLRRVFSPFDPSR
jgi:hypothetical protein